jgi:hypothetical protein
MTAKLLRSTKIRTRNPLPGRPRTTVTRRTRSVCVGYLTKHKTLSPKCNHIRLSHITAENGSQLTSKNLKSKKKETVSSLRKVLTLSSIFSFDADWRTVMATDRQISLSWQTGSPSPVSCYAVHTHKAKNVFQQHFACYEQDTRVWSVKKVTSSCRPVKFWRVTVWIRRDISCHTF